MPLLDGGTGIETPEETLLSGRAFSLVWLRTLALGSVLAMAWLGLASRSLAAARARESDFDATAQIPLSGRLLRDALRGSRTVDIVFLGDSNAAYPYGYGMTNGLLTALLERGGVQYATPLYAMHNANSAIGQSRAGVREGLDDPLGPRTYAPAYDSEPFDGHNALPIRSQIPLAGQPPEIPGQSPLSVQRRFSRGLGKLKPFGQGLQDGTDHANGLWIAAGAWFGNGGHRIEVGPVRWAGAFNADGPAVYSVWYAADAPGGSMRPWVQDGDPTTNDYAFARREFDDTNGGLGQLTWKLRGSPLSSFGWRVFPYHAAGSALGVQGPVAFWWHSVHRHAIGFSMNQLSYFGGRSLADLAVDIEQAAPGYLSRAVEAIRQRALDACGPRHLVIDQSPGADGCAFGEDACEIARREAPRAPGIVFWFEGGINEIASEYGPMPIVESAEMAAGAVLRVAAALHRVAREQGYSDEEIGIVFQSSHQAFPVDSIPEKREAFTLAANSISAADAPWTYLDSARIAPFQMLRDNGAFDELGPWHLRLRGYDILMRRALASLVGDVPPAETGSIDTELPGNPLDPGVGIPCRADVVADLVVDAADLAAVLLAWGDPTLGLRADIDRSGIVDAADLAALLLAWGDCPS